MSDMLFLMILFVHHVTLLC